MASPTWEVVALPPISPVVVPASMTLHTAFSIALASAGLLREYCSSIAVERIAATGLTMPFPAMSGAEPVSGDQDTISSLWAKLAKGKDGG